MARKVRVLEAATTPVTRNTAPGREDLGTKVNQGLSKLAKLPEFQPCGCGN